MTTKILALVLGLGAFPAFAAGTDTTGAAGGANANPGSMSGSTTPGATTPGAATPGAANTGPAGGGVGASGTRESGTCTGGTGAATATSRSDCERQGGAWSTSPSGTSGGANQGTSGTP